MRKTIKKISVIFLLAFMLACILSVVSYADESEVGEEPVTDEALGENNTESPVTEDKNHTFIGRLWESVESNKDMLLTGAVGVLLLGVELVTAQRNRKKAKELVSKVSTIATDTSTVSQSQGSVVDVTNCLVDAFNSLKDTYVQHEREEEERSHTATLIALVCMTMLEMQQQTYQSNRNLPQGIKDVCSLRYAKCLELIRSDEQIGAVYSSIHSMIEGRRKTSEGSNDSAG